MALNCYPRVLYNALSALLHNTCLWSWPDLLSAPVTLSSLEQLWYVRHAQNSEPSQRVAKKTSDTSQLVTKVTNPVPKKDRLPKNKAASIDEAARKDDMGSAKHGSSPDSKLPKLDASDSNEPSVEHGEQPLDRQAGDEMQTEEAQTSGLAFDDDFFLSSDREPTEVSAPSTPFSYPETMSWASKWMQFSTCFQVGIHNQYTT